MGTTISEIESRWCAGVDDGHRPLPTEKTRDLFHRPRRRGEPDASRFAPTIGQLTDTFEGEGEMGAPFRRRERVHLVDDHVLDGAKGFAGLAPEDQVQRLGGGHQDLARVLGLPPSILRAGVAGAHVDARRPIMHAEARGGLSDAHERGPEVPLHVVDQRFERRDVEHAHARLGVLGECAQAVEGEEKRGEGLSAAGGGGQEGVRPAGDRGEALGLHRRRRFEALLEPEPRRRTEELSHRIHR